jgi:hypothetical protein
MGVVEAKTGKFTNLFRHLVMCAECKGKMAHENKGEYQYYRCEQNRRGKGCLPDTTRYDFFESWCYGI